MRPERHGVHSFPFPVFSLRKVVRMKQALKSIALLLFLYLALPSAVPGQKKPPQDAINSCREFVGRFCSWYLANAPKGNQGRAGDVALKYRSYLFSSAVIQAPREDDEAQDKAGPDLVSLDGDPFVGADGPAGNYIVEKVTVKHTSCWAEIHGVWNGKEDQTPDVIPEMAMRNQRWRFVNFYFPTPSNPSGGDLLSALKALREGEKQSGAGKGRKP